MSEKAQNWRTNFLISRLMVLAQDKQIKGTEYRVQKSVHT